MAIRILNVPADSALHGVPEPLKKRIVAAQSDAIEAEFPSARDLCARALADLRIAVRPPRETAHWTAADFGDKPAKELVGFYADALARNRVPEQALALQAANLAHRTQLLRAFHDPDSGDFGNVREGGRRRRRLP